jgi:hypothetical protein
MRNSRVATAAVTISLFVVLGAVPVTAQSPPSPLLATPSLVRYEDPVGDVAGGMGPDIVAVTVSQPDPASVSISVEFASEPPLTYDLEADPRWADVLSVAIGTGPDGVTADPDGHPVTDFDTGVHGVTLERDLEQGAVLASEAGFLEGAVKVAVDGPTVTLTLTRESLGDPDRIMFTMLAGREMEDDEGSGEDFFPDHLGTGLFTQIAWTFLEE